MALAIVPNRTGGGMPFFQPEDPNSLPMGEAPPMIAAAAQPEPQMAAASTQSPSGIMGFLQNPDNQAKMMAFGQGLSQLGAGQAPNIAANPAYQAMMQRQQEGQQRKQMAGLLDGLPPEMRRVLAQMPPQLAQKIILEYTMAQMAPKEPVKLPTSVQEFQYAQENPEFAAFLEGDGKRPTSYQEYQLAAQSDPSVGTYAQWLENKTALQGGIKLTEQQSKDLVYHTRATGSEPDITKYEKALTSPGNQIASQVPGGNYVVSEEFQIGNRAAAEFLAAILRKDTGAAITSQEFDLYGPMYLPRPGDSQATLSAKRDARKRAMEAIQLGLGPAEILAQEMEARRASEGGQSVGPDGGVRLKYNPATGEFE